MFFSCDKEEKGPDVTGRWRGGSVLITFMENGEYGVNYNTAGDENFPVENDSVFGYYEAHNKKSVLTLQKTGHRVRSTQEIVLESALPESWEYTIEDDILKYKNSTIDGEFIKVD